MNGFLKGILMLVVILYIVSPVDAVPGPVDDILLVLFSVAMRRMGTRENS